MKWMMLFVFLCLLSGCASENSDMEPLLPDTGTGPTDTMGYMYRSPPPGAISHLGR